MSQIDLECGDHRGGATSDEGSHCFSDADEGSCYSQFYSTADGSYDDYSFACASDSEIGESRKVSSVAESDCSVDVENEVGEIKVHLGKSERDCQICYLSLESTGPESGIAIELGCSLSLSLYVHVYGFAFVFVFR